MHTFLGDVRFRTARAILLALLISLMTAILVGLPASVADAPGLASLVAR
ncbi:MAG: hypothetical protein QM779_14020 [Propionicimonas sp.]